MTARRRTLAERRAEPVRGKRRRTSSTGSPGSRRQGERKPRTRPVPHPFELPNIGVRSR